VAIQHGRRASGGVTMRLWAIPIVTLAVVTATVSDEPSEGAMRAAFAASLSAQVQNALDFVAEASGEDARDKIKAAGTDRFEIRAFRKLECMHSDGKSGYVCGFAVDIGVIGGEFQQTLTGRFFRGPDGLAFTHDA